MARSKPDPPSPPTHYYTPLPPDENNVVLPFYRPSNPSRRHRNICTASTILFALLVYVFWPSDPDLKIVRLHLNRIQVHTLPVINVDVSLFLTIKVRNADVYYMDFRSLDVSVGYRGKKLGHVTSDQGHVKARASSYVDAEVEFRGVEVMTDVVFLLEDLAKGTVPFDTVTEVTGQLGLFFLKFPLKAKVSCEVFVNTSNQTVARHNCYPKQ